MTALGTLLFLVLGLAGVLSFSAIMKWRDPEGSAAAVEAFRVPARFVPLVAVALPFAEMALALGLVVLPGILFTIVSWLSVALFATFTILVSATLARGDTPDCHCFGELSAEPIGQSTVVRNVVFTLIALVVALTFGDARWPGFIGVVATLSGDPLYLLIILTTIAVLFAIMWAKSKRTDALLAERTAEIVELRARIAPAGIGGGTGAPHPAAPPQPASTPGEIPAGSLFDADGTAVLLRSLPLERAQLLVFASPTCQRCHPVVARVPEWERLLGGVVDIKLVSVGETDATITAFADPERFLYDRDRHIMTSIGARGTPSAVLLGTNGLLGGGPVSGEPLIAEFIDGLLSAIELNRAQSTPMPEPEQAIHSHDEPPRPFASPGALPPSAALSTTEASWVGAALPEATIETAEGEHSTLRNAIGALGPGTRALVFWRADCEYSQSILSEVGAASARGRAVLVTTSDAVRVREQGIRGPLLVSTDRSAMTAMQVPGTPVGFLLEGTSVAEGPFIGADAVRELVARV